MAKFNVPEAEHNELFDIVENTKGDIVSPSASLWRHILPPRNAEQRSCVRCHASG